jgi:alpha-ribazole phosphatase
VNNTQTRKPAVDCLVQELIFIRHAATDMAGTLCGASDPPLNSAGREQADLLAHSLQPCNFTRLYTSDLKRAIQTAQAIERVCGAEIIVRPDLREVSFGGWEGKRWSQIVAENPDIRSSPREFCTPGGETFEYFRERVLRGLRNIAAESNGKRAAVVTHLGVIRLVLDELGLENEILRQGQRIDCCWCHSVFLRMDSDDEIPGVPG